MSLPAEARSSASGSATAIIPTYNREEYLGEALASILRQTFRPTQIIVVDDGSIDATRDVVSRYGPPVEYIAKPNGGKSSALNLGMRCAIGEFIWIFDDDDIAEPNALARLVDALQGNPRCGFAYGEYDMFTANAHGNMQKTRAVFPAVKPQNLYLALMERSFILQQGLLVKRTCYDSVGVFDESLIRSQDLDMMLRLARRYSGVKIDGITFHLRLHGGIRGSKAAPVQAKRVIDGWVAADRRIMGKIYATHDLRDFLPAGLQAAELTEEQKFTALLQRMCIMARKGMWHEAAEDLRRASGKALATHGIQLGRDHNEILHRVFDLFSYAPYAFGGASEFRQTLNEIKPARLRRSIRAAIIWSLPFTIGAVLLHGQYANSWRFLGVYFSLATPDAVLRTVFSRAFFRTAMELVRARRSAAISQGRDKQETRSAPAV